MCAAPQFVTCAFIKIALAKKSLKYRLTLLQLLLTHFYQSLIYLSPSFATALEDLTWVLLDF